MNTHESQVIVDQPNVTIWANMGLINELMKMKALVKAPVFLSEGTQQ